MLISVLGRVLISVFGSADVGFRTSADVGFWPSADIKPSFSIIIYMNIFCITLDAAVHAALRMIDRKAPAARKLRDRMASASETAGGVAAGA